MDYAFCEGSMEDCGTQQEIFDEIEDSESDDEPPPSSARIKTAEDTPEGKTPSRRRKLQEKNESEVKLKKSKVS